ncbi:MAG: ATP-binding cassette domain-containing protein [Sedimentisphaerales bacterium]|nr:ATP-binding cassette domain-containing protein [Sedimentisphaerales bacterium]
MNEPAALEAVDVTVLFDGHAVLQDFSMSLGAGETALLTGPSGCGKSTVLRCLLGFVAPETGSVRVEGQPLTAETVWHLRRHLAYVGQEPELGAGTVSEVLERPFHYRANAGLRDNLERVGALFERFALARGLLDKEAGDLSGGEKQRVALIAAILLDRPIFLLDEVTSALDRAGKQVVADYFRSRDDATVLLVAHDPDLFPYADQEVPVGPGSGGAA